MDLLGGRRMQLGRVLDEEAPDVVPVVLPDEKRVHEKRATRSFSDEE
jgi:hypothetical protein